MARRMVSTTQVKIQKALSGYSSTAAITAGDLPLPPKPPSATLDFSDTKALFAAVPTGALLRAAAVLHAAASGPLVDIGSRVLNSRMMELAPVRDVVLGAVRHTFYQHFCAGEDAGAVGDTVRRLHTAGIRSMLDYAVEFADDNEACDRNLASFLETVEFTKSLPPASASFVVVKISAICPLALLERISDLLRWNQKQPSFPLPWKLPCFPLFSPSSSPLYHTPLPPPPLSSSEELDLHRVHHRLSTLSAACLSAAVPLAVDAELSTLQPAIDYFTHSAAISFNPLSPSPTVFSTVQAYLRDAPDRLRLLASAAQDMGVPIGVKLVRGAYMAREAAMAAERGAESPVHGSVGETHECYDGCVGYMMEEVVGKGKGAMVVASHNVESGRKAVGKAREMGVGKVRERVEFAQLYGMAEGLSWGLRNAGFRVSKYMPFGAVETVMPYLLRRADENRGLLAASGFDRQLMRKELKRRLTNCFLR